MKWLLITTTKNPGDSFARMGIENLIKEVDASAEFILLDKEDPASFETPVEFDRAIYCGMPLFWSTSEQTCSEIWWWDKIFSGWPTADKKRFACIGVGDVFGINGIYDPAKYLEAVSQVNRASAFVTVRNPLREIPNELFIQSVCPSLFALHPAATEKPFKLANLMPGGAHDEIMDRAEAGIWKEHLKKIAAYLVAEGFEFIAHSLDEVELAGQLKFSAVHYFPKHEDYLTPYSQCTEYVGNRLHGAMLAFRAGARVIAIGYDSRMAMLHRVGCDSTTPTWFASQVFFGSKITEEEIVSIEYERKKLTEILRGFA